MKQMYDSFDLCELQKELELLNDELEEIEELRIMQLGQTGHHISGKLVGEYAKMTKDVNEKIILLKSCIEKLNEANKK